VQQGFHRLNVDATYAPFANGGFPTPSGKCECLVGVDARARRGSAAGVVLRASPRLTDPARAARYPLAFISPPARNFLNSSFANLPSFVAEERSPRLLIHPDDAAPRRIVDGTR